MSTPNHKKKSKFSAGPHSRPVYSKSLGRWFKTTTDAATFLSKTSVLPVKRFHIRTAIVRKSRCAGHSWSYDGPGGKPESKVYPNGRAIPVKVTRFGRTRVIASMSKAAKLIGRADVTLKRALKAGRGKATIGGIKFSVVMKKAGKENSKLFKRLAKQERKSK